MLKDHQCPTYTNSISVSGVSFHALSSLSLFTFVPQNVKIYAVECNGESYERFYHHIASQTFGYFMPLSDINNVKQLLMNICFREAGLEGVSILHIKHVLSKHRYKTCQTSGSFILVKKEMQKTLV